MHWDVDDQKNGLWPIPWSDVPQDAFISIQNDPQKRYFILINSLPQMSNAFVHFVLTGSQFSDFCGPFI